MDNLAVKVIVIGIVLLIIAAVVTPRIRGPRLRATRTRSMAKLSADHGWTFAAQCEAMLPLVQRLPRSHGLAVDRISSKVMKMDPMRRAVGSVVANGIEGRVDGHAVRIFDWVAAHGTSGGKVLAVYLHTVWAIELPQVPFWVQAASRAQDYDDWQPGTWFTTGDAEFDKRFRATCEDASHLRAGLTPQTRHLLLHSSFDGWRLAPEHKLLLLWTHSRRHHAPVERIVEMTHQAVALAAVAANVRAA